MSESVNFQYNNPLIVKPKLCNGCSFPENPDTFPYSEDVFKTISNISGLIAYYSNLYNIPPIALAGSIADEYNSRKGWRSIVDWFQDDVLLNWMPNFAIEFDVYINVDSKYLNATKHDLGIGNVKLETAKKLYNEYYLTFKNKNWDYTDLVDYIRSDSGTVHLAALVMRKAKSILGSYITNYEANKQEAVLVTYYKQGDIYVKKFKDNLKRDSSHKIKPGEGCRVCLQRKRILKALKISE